jgi:hypothetical protein
MPVSASHGRRAAAQAVGQWPVRPEELNLERLIPLGRQAGGPTRRVVIRDGASVDAADSFLYADSCGPHAILADVLSSVTSDRVVLNALTRRIKFYPQQPARLLTLVTTEQNLPQYYINKAMPLLHTDVASIRQLSTVTLLSPEIDTTVYTIWINVLDHVSVVEHPSPETWMRFQFALIVSWKHDRAVLKWFDDSYD